MIPLKYLLKMGSYNVKVQGVALQVNVVQEPSLIERHMYEFIRSVLAAETQVVAVDVKISTSPPKTLLVFYAGAQVLVIHQCRWKLVPSIVKFFEDPKICFVRAQGTDLATYLWVKTSGVGVGDLAARVLQKPCLTWAPLAEISSDATVPYEGPSCGIGMDVKLDENNPEVLSEEHVKLVVHDAYSFYHIGLQLLSYVESLACLSKSSSTKSGLGWFSLRHIIPSCAAPSTIQTN